jgi:hypothetical protein
LRTGTPKKFADLLPFNEPISCGGDLRSKNCVPISVVRFEEVTDLYITHFAIQVDFYAVCFIYTYSKRVSCLCFPGRYRLFFIFIVFYLLKCIFCFLLALVVGVSLGWVIDQITIKTPNPKSVSTVFNRVYL